MKPEYIEGRKATENFEEGMKALFKVPKSSIARNSAARGEFPDARPCHRKSVGVFRLRKDFTS
jgi:hypothetical protein